MPSRPDPARLRTASWRHFFALYSLWIFLCGVLFVSLRGAHDPALPTGRITEREAIQVAATALTGGTGTGSWRFVHAAHSPSGELGDEARWVILFAPAAAAPELESLVVELAAEDGRLLEVRHPVPRHAG